MGLLLLCFLSAVAAGSSDWSVLGDAPESETVGLFIALKHRNLGAFNDAFEKASNPDSKEFRKWLTNDAVLSMISPPAKDSQSVVDWVSSTCKSGSVQTLDNRRDTIRVEATVACVKQLFPSIRLATYTHRVRSAQVVRLHTESISASVPAHLSHIVDLVIGLDLLPVVRKKKIRPVKNPAVLKKRSGDASYSYVYPGDWNRVYNIQTNVVGQAGATQGVIEFSPEGAPSWQDLQKYDELSNVPFTNFSTITGPFQPGNDGESLLDIQLISAVAYTPTQYITIPDSWAYGMAQELFNQGASAVRVASVSYGWPEANTCQSQVTHAQCQSTAQAYIARSEIEIQKATATGITFVICSQDEGAPSEANIDCSNTEKPVWPVYPGSSAFATSVSATTLESGSSGSDASLPPICNGAYKCSGGSSEIPCSVGNTDFHWTTGGGFSDYISSPAWQTDARTQYLASGVTFPASNHFNSSNRFYADVAAFGSRLLVVQNQQVSVSAGTSASTPIIAGIVTLINDALLSAGKPVVGFLNPALYKAGKECPQCFNQIKTGNNICSEGQCCSATSGYYVASSGANAVTGWGTINVQELIKYMLTL